MPADDVVRWNRFWFLFYL